MKLDVFAFLKAVSTNKVLLKGKTRVNLRFVFCLIRKGIIYDQIWKVWSQKWSIKIDYDQYRRCLTCNPCGAKKRS